MSGINTTNTVYLKALTPVHVGGAQEKNLQKGQDYVQLGDGKTWKLDWSKIYKHYDVDKISTAILNNKVLRLIENHIEEVAIEIEQSFGDTGVIKAFIRDGMGVPYIPGSSIKGAMKSWLHSALEEQFQLGRTGDLLGNFENDIFRFISITDCYLDLEPILYPTKTFNLFKSGSEWEGGWKHALHNNTNRDFKTTGFVTDYESMAPNDVGSLEIKLRKPLDASFKNKLYRKDSNQEKSYHSIFNGDSLRSLFSILNKKVCNHIEKELHFFKRFNQAEYANEILDSFYQLQSMCKNLSEEQCILRISAGSGFHGISGDFQFDDHIDTGMWTIEDAGKYRLPKRLHGKYIGHYLKFKSRKIAFTPNAMYPMGFVLLSEKSFEAE